MTTTHLRIEPNVLPDFSREFDDAGKVAVFETGGESFDDGYCLEVVKSGVGSLAFMDSKSQNVHNKISFAGQKYVPPALEPSLLEAVTLPRKRTDCVSTVELFKEVYDIFVGYGVSGPVAQICTFFTFASWFPKLLPVAPCLVFIGGESEAGVLLQLLNCVVRHGIPLAEVSVATFDCFPMHLQPTMLIRRLRAPNWGLLSASNHPHANVVRKNRLTDLYCLKAVYAGPNAHGVEGEGIFKVHCTVYGGRLHTINDAVREKIAARLQPKLLDYCLKNSARVRNAEFDVKTLPISLRTSAQAIGACIVDAPNLQADLLRFLEGYGEELRENRMFDPNSVVIEALLVFCHSEKASARVGVSEVADKAASIMAERGKRGALDPKNVGSLLRLLGFDAKRDSKGFAIRLTDDVRRLIHRLARMQEIGGMELNAVGCSNCAEVASTQT